MSLIALQGGIYAQRVHPFTLFHKLHTLSHPNNETMRDDDRMTLTEVTVLLPPATTNSTCGLQSSPLSALRVLMQQHTHTQTYTHKHSQSHLSTTIL